MSRWPSNFYLYYSDPGPASVTRSNGRALLQAADYGGRYAFFKPLIAIINMRDFSPRGVISARGWLDGTLAVTLLSTNNLKFAFLRNCNLERIDRVILHLSATSNEQSNRLKHQSYTEYRIYLLLRIKQRAQLLSGDKIHTKKTSYRIRKINLNDPRNLHLPRKGGARNTIIEQRNHGGNLLSSPLSRGLVHRCANHHPVIGG